MCSLACASVAAAMKEFTKVVWIFVLSPKQVLHLFGSPHSTAVCIAEWSNQAYLTWRSGTHYSLAEYIKWIAGESNVACAWIHHENIMECRNRKMQSGGQGQTYLWSLSTKHITNCFFKATNDINSGWNYAGYTCGFNKSQTCLAVWPA